MNGRPANPKYARNKNVLVIGGSGSGHWYPVRLKLRKEDGMWRIEELTESEDGECYWPSIVSMCGGDERLAEKLIQTENGIREATRLYLQAAGCPDAAAGME